MRRKAVWLGLMTLLGCAVAGTAKAPEASDLTVHEWGTFLAMQGSDGVTLDGMYHEEHALPAFVHARSKEQLHIRATDLKGETPVIYFYTNHRQNVQVTVRFPQGVWTQWYPQAVMVGPPQAQVGAPLTPQHGRVRWYAEILPAGHGASPPLPQTETGALWNYARDVDAAYVKTIDTAKG